MVTDLQHPDGIWVPESTVLRHRVQNSVVSNHLHLNHHIYFPFKVISAPGYSSNSRNVAGDNDTLYVLLAPSGEKLRTVQYQSV